RIDGPVALAAWGHTSGSRDSQDMFSPIKDTHKRPARTKYFRGPKEMHRMVETLRKSFFK
ncbi:MAG: hypothetical protein LQ349_007005, partial [Xanthoria aureola]